MPGIVDSENNPIAVLNLIKPSFVVFDSSLMGFSIKPVNPVTDLGMFTVKG